MDIQQYISSGIIEAYVLGIASAEEVYELKSLAAKHPEIGEAIDDCRKTMEDYADQHATPPPPDLKKQIWSALEEQGPVTNHTSPPAPPASPVMAMPKRSGGFLRPLAAVASILLLISLGLNYLSWRRVQFSEATIRTMLAAQSKGIALMQHQLATLKHDRDMLMDPAMKTVMLAGVGAHTDNHAMVLWDTRTKEVYLSLKSLPPPPRGKQYQLWAIVDGKPVDAGIYVVQTESMLQKMSIIPSAQMFAITLEKEGGSPTPTMDAMFVAGKV